MVVGVIKFEMVLLEVGEEFNGWVGVIWELEFNM